MIIYKMDIVMEEPEKHTTPDIFGGFTYDDFAIFEGGILGVSSTFAHNCINHRIRCFSNA